MFTALALAAGLVIPHQGRLLTGDDKPATGPHTLQLALYTQPQGGSAVWDDSFQVAIDAQGAYALVLGDADNHQKALALGDVGPEPRWLGIKVDGGSELSPRLRLGSSPLAARAQLADAVKGQVEATGAILQNGKELVSADGHFQGPTDNLDAATVAGVGVSRTAQPGALLPLDQGGKLPTSVLNTGASGDIDAASFSGGKKWADVTGAITQAVGQGTSNAAKVDQQNAFSAQNNFQAQVNFNGGAIFNQPPAFAGTGGSAPFNVQPGATGMVANLNAEMVGGKHASDFLLAATYKPPVAGTERLVLNFDEGSSGGTTVRDTSGGALDGTFVASTLTRTTAGHNGTGALVFAAGGGYVTVPDNAALDVTNNLTLEAWIFPTAYAGGSNESTVLMKESQYGLRLDGTGHLQAAINTGVANSWTWTGSTSAVPLNQWSHVAATYDGLVIRLFVNGMLQSMVSWQRGPLATNANPLTIGGRTTSQSATFIGSIDEVRVSAVAKDFFTPQKPAFTAVLGANDTAMGTRILHIDTVRVNQGGAYNPSIGRFTAPATGTYVFSYGSIKTNGASYVGRMNPLVNGSGTVCPEARTEEGSTYGAASATCVLLLNAGDYVEIQGSDNGGFYQSYTHFSGYQIN